ncbi:DsbA family protein [Rhizobium leguminosarum]|uniref:DsbA family protein n=1 Tax=Rhizobium leguminosarum TaxID=384 RepID=UPI001441910B|nr:DsbA family protein [Rhizobium leguminosarum]NKM99245.1 thioredoxin [Rhizobium leguminosarum bv. viciae]
MTTTAWHADPLTWGNGPRIFEAFLEPTCPYSVRAFNKFDELLSQAGEDKITVKIRLQPQPWHMYSGVLVRCIIAASTLEGGKQTAKQVISAIAAHREENGIHVSPTFMIDGLVQPDMSSGDEVGAWVKKTLGN